MGMLWTSKRWTRRVTFFNSRHWTGLNFDERRQFGLACKRALDIGRLEALKQCGAEAELVYYIEAETSLENMALVARWP